MKFNGSRAHFRLSVASLFVVATVIALLLVAGLPAPQPSSPPGHQTGLRTDTCSSAPAAPDSNGNTGTANGPVTVGTLTTVHGDSLYAAVLTAGATLTTANVPTAPSDTFHYADGFSYSAGFYNLTLFYADNVAAASAGSLTVTFTWTGAGGNEVDVFVVVVNNSLASGSLGAVGTGEYNASGVTTAPLTTTAVESMVLTAEGSDRPAAGSGWVSPAVLISTGGTAVGFGTNYYTQGANQTAVTIGYYPASFTPGGIHTGVISVEVKSACAGVGHVPPAPVVSEFTSAKGISTSEIDLNWTNPAGPLTDNHVYIYTDTSAFLCNSLVTTVDLGTVATSYHDTGLLSNAVYSYKISANNTTGESSLSACALNSTFPTPPTGLVAASAGPTSIKLTWSNPADPYAILDENGYWEWAGSSSCSGAPTTKVSLGSTTSPTTVTGLTNGVRYAFEVNVSNTATFTYESWSGLSGCASVVAGAVALHTPPWSYAPTGADGFDLYARSTTTLWENVTGGVAPFNYTWAFVRNGTAASRIAEFGWFNGEANGTTSSRVIETNVTLNFTGNYTIVVNVTDHDGSHNSSWVANFTQNECEPTFTCSTNPVYEQQVVSFVLRGPAIYPYNSNGSYGSAVTILATISGALPFDAPYDFCTPYSAGWIFQSHVYGVNQTGCASQTEPVLVLKTFNLTVGNYTVTGWAVDPVTHLNHTTIYHFRVLASQNRSVGPPGPPFPASPYLLLFVIVAILILAAAIAWVIIRSRD